MYLINIHISLMDVKLFWLKYLDNRSVELLLDRVELLLHGHDLLVAVSDFVFGISGLLLGGLEFVLDLKKGSISAEKSIQTFWSRSLAELSSSSVAFCFLRSAWSSSSALPAFSSAALIFNGIESDRYDFTFLAFSADSARSRASSLST